jgi:hypothetical protein
MGSARINGRCIPYISLPQTDLQEAPTLNVRGTPAEPEWKPARQEPRPPGEGCGIAAAYLSVRGPFPMESPVSVSISSRWCGLPPASPTYRPLRSMQRVKRSCSPVAAIHN